MAIRYGDGKAGQFAKTKAQQHFDRLIIINVALAGLFCAVTGLLLGGILLGPALQSSGFYRRFSRNEVIWWSVAFQLLLLAAASVSFRLLRKPIDKLSLGRIYWLHGGQVESLVAWTLRDLPNDWHLFNNLKPKNGGDIDHVLVGPGGVFCISTKSNKGTYSLALDGGALLNGKPTDHLAEARQMALKVRNWLEVKLHNQPAVKTVPWVQPVLAVPFAFVDIPSREKAVWVMGEEELFAELCNSHKKLGSAEIKACAAAIESMR